MKRLNFFLLGLAVLGMAFFSSCGDTTNAVPTITLDDAGPIAATGGSVTLTGQINAEAKLKEVKLYIVTTTDETQYGSAYTSFSSGDITTNDNVTYNFRFTVNVTENCKVKIEVTDKDDQTASKSVEVTVSAAINSFSAVLMGAQSNTNNGSTASLETGVVYKISGSEAKNNSDKVDIVYYYGSKQAAIYAPTQSDILAVSSFDISSWATKNNTKLGLSSLSSGEFDAISDASGFDNAGTPSLDVVPNLAANDVVVFETASGKKGVFKVTSLTTGSTGSITISVKVEQ